ncbi:MFS general substrate transporter [Mycena olivaceomarginata]|nr:MFS general substrate transporter [Mycena olivaceomarginata]
MDASKQSNDHNSSDEKIDGQYKSNDIEVSATDIDTAAAIVSGDEFELDPQAAKAVRRKIDWHILPLMCSHALAPAFVFWMKRYRTSGPDKATLGNAAILGLREETHLTTNQYNWLGTLFYLRYLVFEFPQNLALQRFPVAKWLSINIFVWGVALFAHAGCKNFAGLLIVRLVLGMCEGSITAGFLIVSSMFYTHHEQTTRVGYWFLMNGAAQIISGFISFGTLHITTSRFEPWQWLMIITGIITFITAALFWFLFPDSPTTAWFLSPHERAIAVLRIRENQTGVENKHFKREQMVEALVDPKTWSFALLSALTNVPNSLSNQRTIIVSSFGFTVLQTTLLSCVDRIVEVITIWVGIHVAAKTNQRAYTAFCWKIPNIVGASLVNTLPWSNKIGLLFSLWITGQCSVGTTAFVIALSWLSSVTAGHMKRITTKLVQLRQDFPRSNEEGHTWFAAAELDADREILYSHDRLQRDYFIGCKIRCVGNAVGPFMWQAKYKPRNRIPWIIIGCCFVICMAIFLIIRSILAAENKRRDAEPQSKEMFDNAYVEQPSADGTMVKVKVDRAFLDLTERQNRDFRYVS